MILFGKVLNFTNDWFSPLINVLNFKEFFCFKYKPKIAYFFLDVVDEITIFFLFFAC